MNAPVSRTPKRTRRKVNLVWFVETSRTHSFALSFRTLWLAVGAVALGAGAIVGEAVYIRKLNRELESHQVLVRDLKQAVVTNLFARATERTEASAEVPIPKAAVPAEETKPAAPPQVQAATTPTPKPKPPSEAVDVLFEKPNLAEAQGGGTLVRFVLSTPGAEAREEALAGRVCAIVQSSSGERLLAAKEELKPMGNAPGCPEGLNVRFSKLRPTEIFVKMQPSEIRTVELRFVDRQTKKSVTHTITN